MPPRPKYTKEEITEAAFQLAKERGIDAVVAREVGKTLGTSSSPIFTFFKTMEELQSAVIERAREDFCLYLQQANDYYPTFKKRGMLFVEYAKNNPNIFRLLFMKKEHAISFEELMKESRIDFEMDIQTIQNDYHATEQQAFQIFNHVWIHAYGICALTASGVCDFSNEEISTMLGETFNSMILLVKSGIDYYEKQPEKKDPQKISEMKKGAPIIG